MKSKKDSLKIEKGNLIAIGDRIIDIRKKLRINQKEFAASLDMSPSYLSTIEGGNGNPGVGFFFRLAMIYNVNLNYLFLEPGKCLKIMKSEDRQKKKNLSIISIHLKI